jgi:methylisocitrate lyase
VPPDATSKIRSWPSDAGIVRTRRLFPPAKWSIESRRRSTLVQKDAFVVMARTDAVASEGLQAGIDRACAYVAAGADMIFAEALHTLEDYRRFTKNVSAPVLANITEFGKTPLFSVEELREVGVRLVLYPLSAFRAMSAAAMRVYAIIRSEGTQRALIEQMQTRTELYDVLNYHAFEEKLDELFTKKKNL